MCRDRTIDMVGRVGFSKHVQIFGGKRRKNAMHYLLFSYVLLI